METIAIPQPILLGRPRSGDGTVPYASLAYPRLWSVALQRERALAKSEEVQNDVVHSPVNIEMVELDQVEQKDVEW